MVYDDFDDVYCSDGFGGFLFIMTLYLFRVVWFFPNNIRLWVYLVFAGFDISRPLRATTTRVVIVIVVVFVLTRRRRKHNQTQSNTIKHNRTQ